MEEQILDFLNKALSVKDRSTWIFNLATSKSKKWAIVAGWMDYDDNDDWQLYAKVAYLPTNSLMSEYDFDWIMPEEDDGYIFDTEICIGNLPFSACMADVDWLLRCWRTIEVHEHAKERSTA